MSEKKIKMSVTLPYTILVLIMICMVLTGCDLHEPSKLAQKRVQVEEQKFSDTVSVADLNEAALYGLATHYEKHGDGPLGVTITYDPKSSVGSAMHASDEVARISSTLRANGVYDVRSTILPVVGSGDEMNAIVSYTAYNALAPNDCEVMPGIDHYNVEAEESYELGCTRETLFAKQIARPKDLRGNSSAGQTTDGRRSANTVEVYRTGVPNEALEGESSTDQ